MDKSELIKKLVIIAEVIICIIAVIVIIFNIQKAEPLEEDTTGLSVSDYEEVGEIPSTNTELSSFIDNYLDKDGVDEPFEEEQTEVSDSDSENIDDTETLEKQTAEKLPDKNDWRLILVNKQHVIPEGYEVNLVNINGSKQVDERIAEDLAAMLDKARSDKVALMIVSAYRSQERQTSLFNNKIHKNMNKGMSYLDAYSAAAGTVTPPGTSEHQLGLALDILGSGHSGLTENFADTEAGKWLKANCADYGFILRYPEGKEYITGIIYEPWHFRYVGKKYAKEIMSRGITLEEYLEGK